MIQNQAVHHDINVDLSSLATSNIKVSEGEENHDDGDVNNPFAYGLSVLDNLVLVLQEMANAIYYKINSNANRARNTQEMSNRVDETIASAAKGDDKQHEKLPDEVINYMRDNGILVDGMTIDAYIKKHGDSLALDKGSLQAVKAALDNSASRDTDLMTQGQLTIQKMTQETNAAITQATGLISKWGDLLSMIAQKMY